jgi:hypothetical protein
LRVSIWRQFASNHSNGFQVVGQFESVEAAAAATAILRDMLHLIIQFRTDYWQEDPTWPEYDFAEKFQVEWQYSLDWAADENVDVVQFDQYVFCGNVILETYLGAAPIDDIMRKLTSKVVVEEIMGRFVLAVELTCTAPSLHAAEKISEDLEPYLKAQRASYSPNDAPPWRPYAQLAAGQYYDDQVYFGYARKSHRNLIFSKMKFAEVGYGLPALIGYLKANGCENIQYRIEERDQDDIFKGDPPD